MEKERGREIIFHPPRGLVHESIMYSTHYHLCYSEARASACTRKPRGTSAAAWRGVAWRRAEYGAE